MGCPTCDLNPTDNPASFRPAPGYMGYCVGEDGSVWSCVGTGVWRKLKPTPCGHDGRLKVTLCPTGGKRTQVYVHLLVLTAFRGPAPEGMWGLHNDDNCTNNQLDNLRWGTPADNSADAIKNGKHWTPFRRPPAATPEQVEMVREWTQLGSTTRQLAAKTGLSKSTIHQIVARKGVYAEASCDGL